ncbi:MAG: hypothetical protein Q8K21_06695 [Hydrogenophaga sp.]|uniref:hypothetical protein n=1 Tax=Hydrogenophaga sp. TaxID=1904254 RepID=UPI002730A52D|nr:hypothetical protein [Hydrogenophaga sp.]MDP2163896.1 hypothetical protein [Hydrogenophaga sp.]MDP3476082.1 hypothetical protein [Hydrogenophaga sp.]
MDATLDHKRRTAHTNAIEAGGYRCGFLGPGDFSARWDELPRPAVPFAGGDAARATAGALGARSLPSRFWPLVFFVGLP